MTNEQFLQVLQERGLIDEAGAAKLKRDALIANRSVEDIVAERRIVDGALVAQMKSELLQVPYQKVDPESIDAKLMELIPENTVRTYGVIPLSHRDGVLIAGMVSPDDLKAQDALKFIAHKGHVSLGVYVISYDDWQAVLRKYSPFKTNIEAAVSSMNLKPGDAQKVISLDEVRKTGEEAPVIKIVSDTFREAVQSGASDVHVEPQEGRLRIRFRNDGDLHEVSSLPAELIQPITSRIKVISNLKIDETRVPQDGRFRAKILDRDIDFRVATFPTPLGEKIAIRVLDPSTGLKTFEQLGLIGNNLAFMEEGLGKSYGMILITGPTGSGKSTTLYSFLSAMNKEDVNIVSLEDPVEYFVSGVNQSQVKPEIGYDFASGLRQILRQDPDVIMVGEIRDRETAGLAVQAALTGHIVLSTLHTNNAAGVIPRLLDMKVEPFLLPVALATMLAQRLVGTLCQKCKVAEPASAKFAAAIEKALDGVPEELTKEFKKPYQIYHSPGCNACRGKGIVGRVAVFEVLKMTPELGTIIEKGAQLADVVAEAKRQGMLSLRQDGVLKALKGLVSMEEVMRVTDEG